MGFLIVPLDVDYRSGADTSFLSKFLDASTMQDIADASAVPRQEIDALAAKIDEDAQAAAEKRAA